MMMVREVFSRGRCVGGRTELQQKGSSARRHEADRDVGSKQQRGQQKHGQYVRSPTLMQSVSHSLAANDARARPIAPVVRGLTHLF